MNKNLAPVWLYLGLVAFSLVGSYACRVGHMDPGPVGRPTSLVTLLVGCYAVFGPFFASGGTLTRIGIVAVLIVGGLAELVGLITGFPFGRYAYTDRWWPALNLGSIGFFPIQLPFAWALVVGASYLSLASRWGRWAMAGSAVIACLVDQAMEPTMAGPLHYWRWIDQGPMPGGAPIENALGWIGVSAVGAAILFKTLPLTAARSRVAALVLAGHLALCFGLNVLSSR